MLNEKKLQGLIEEAVQNHLKSMGVSVKHITSEQLCERWQITMKTLEKWRLQGKPPVYIKLQGGQKSIIRYPLHAENGVLDVESKWLRSSTTDTGDKEDGTDTD